MLWKNGTVLVLMTKITSDCVNKDSTNQAVWNNDASALKTQSMTKNVAKSKIELTGPKAIMKFRINDVLSRCGCWTYVWSTVSLGRLSCAKE